MKSPEINPLAAAEDATPPPVERASDRERRDGGGRVPIAVSDGDFSTPTKRQRTITRPRGLKTLEQLANTPQPPPSVEILAAPTVGVPEPQTPPAVTPNPPPQAATVVDEFLATPPTPEPEVEVTPPPVAVSPVEATSRSGDTATAHVDASLTPELGPSGRHLSPSTPTPAALSSGSPTEDPLALLTRSDVPLIESIAEALAVPREQQEEVRTQQAVEISITPGPITSDVTAARSGDAVMMRESETALGTEDVSALAPGYGRVSVAEDVSLRSGEDPFAVASENVAAVASEDTAALIGDSIASVADEELASVTSERGTPVASESVAAAVTPESASALANENVRVVAGEDTGAFARDHAAVIAGEDVPLTPASRDAEEAPPIAESDLSPLAQTLAHMAESMQAELPIESALDLEIVDGPLVPTLTEALISARTATPPPRPMPPRPPPLAPAVGVPADRPLLVPPFVGLPEALAERPRRPKRSKPWFEEVFDESYLRTLPFMTAEQTLREVDFIESSLAIPKGGEVLDIGCGYGRHAIELVQRGLAVTGLDLSLPLLIRAADESQRRSVTVNFVHTDMREMAFERQFSGAYCMLTSFGYFDEESNLKVAEGIARALKPGGRFLLDVINRDYIVSDLPARVWWEGDGCVVLEEVDFNFNTNRVLTHRSVVFDDGQQLEQEISVRVYSLHEMGKLLRQAGFRVIEVSGSIPTRGHFFGASSRNLLILAERRVE